MDNRQYLTDIRTLIPDVVLDIRYATDRNFTGAILYGRPEAWLCAEPLQKLANAAHQLRMQGYRLVIFDAYRSPSVQNRLREAFSDDNYVKVISNHCRGITVDLTICDETGAYLDMGSDYDDFSQKSHPGTSLITEDQAKNRKLLADWMKQEGFLQHPHEWWHFDYEQGLEWPLITDERNTYRGK